MAEPITHTQENTSSAYALDGQPAPARRARAVAVWAMGAAVAATSGPVLGGVPTLVSWRLIFFVNLPAGALAVALLARARRSPHRKVPLDWAGQAG